MSTNYTHLDQIAFDKLFGYGSDGKEIQLLDGAGNFTPTSVTLKSLTSDPTSPSEGEVWYNSTAKKLRTYQNGHTRDLDRGVLSVKDFGAVGDGSTDDTTAFQAALNAANPGNAIIFVPEGTYKLTSQITWPQITGITLVGCGQSQSNIQFSWGGSPSTTSYGIVANSSSSGVFTLSGLTFQGGTSSSDSTIYEILQIGNSIGDVRIIDCEFKWCRHSAVRVTASSPGSRMWIRNCYFHDINTPGQMTGIAGGAILGFMPKTIIQGNQFSNIGNSSLYHAVYGETTDVLITNNIFSGPSANSNTNLQMFSTSSANAVISANVFENSEAVFSNITNGSFLNNTLYDSILNVSCDRFLIANNVFQAVTLNGSNLIVNGNAATKLHITGNVLQDTSGFVNLGIYDANSSADSWIVSNNYLVNISKPMKFLGSNHHIQGNHIVTTSNNNMIDIAGGSGHIVQDNIINAGASAVAVSNTSGSTIQSRNNTIIGGGKESGTSGSITHIAQPVATTGVRVVTASYTPTIQDSIILCNAATASVSVTLPAASGSVVGRYKQYTFKRIDSSANSVTITRAGSDTIDGTTSTTLANQYNSIILTADPDNNRWETTAHKLGIGTANGLSISGASLSMAAASTSATGVITTGTQSFAGTKTFATPLAGSNVASASTSASGVVTASAQSLAGVKTFANGAQFLTSGGTATTLNYYEEGTFTANFNGGAGSGGSGTSFTVDFVRVGALVTLSFPNMSSMTSGGTPSSSFIAASGTIPSRLRPVASQYGYYLASLGATTTGGTWNIQTNGEIDLYRDLANLNTNWATGTANLGAFGFSVSYYV